MQSKKCDPETNFSNDFCLEVLPVKKDITGINLRRPIHPILPNANQGANLLICASVRSGKSNLISNLLLNSNFFREAFETVYVFSKTINQDATMKRLKEAFPATCYEDFSEVKLQKILDHQRTFEDDERPAICIVCDDLQTIKKSSLFFNLATNFRHYGIGLLIYSIQSFKMCPPIVRSNVTNILIGTNNSNTMKQIAETYGDSFGGDENFIRHHRMAVDKRFQFLYGRLDEYPAVLHKNFDENPIYTDDF